MKFVSFQIHNTPMGCSTNTTDKVRVGILRGDNALVDLALAEQILTNHNSGCFSSMLSLIEGGKQALMIAAEMEAKATDEVLIQPGKYDLLAPIPVPPQIRDFMAFELHVKQAGESVMKLLASQEEDPVAAEATLRASGKFGVPQVWYKQPLYYKCNRFAVNHPDADINWPVYSKVMDYELELACVIGKGGRDISERNANEHIFGFTIFNDFSARDAQSQEMSGPLGPAKGKDFDGANAMGPCLVTLDEIGDPYNLDMIVRVNGEERSRGNSASIYWSFEKIIEFLSRSETLYPGEILGSGTIGNGCGLELGYYLNHGDVVELEIEKIGTLRNRISVAD